MNEQDTENTKKINTPVDKEYVEIIKSDSDVNKEFTAPNGKPAKIIYYCRECKKPVTPKRIGRKLSFKCSECEHSPIAFGTEDSIKNYFNVK